MENCKLCGGEWFVSSPAGGGSPDQWAHYCSRTGRREARTGDGSMTAERTYEEAGVDPARDIVTGRTRAATPER